MGAPSIGRVALMSIHPKYADAIMTGKKRVEFRKRPIAADVTHVIVYATAPVSAVIGAFAVTGQVTSPPRSLWRRFRRVGGISRSRFFDYFAAHESGTGIGVGLVLVPPAPLSLVEDLGLRHPPQSFRYLDERSAATVLTSMVPST